MGVCAAMLARDAPNKSVMLHKDHVHHWWYKTTTKITLAPMLQNPKVHNSSGLYGHLSAIVCRLEIFLCVRKGNVIIVLWTESLGGD
jgi:hypothetical protein